MRIGTAISIVTLATSTAALALVLWLVITQPWVVEEPAPVVATPTFTEDEVLVAVRAHIMRNGDMSTCYALSVGDDESWEIRQDPFNPEKYTAEHWGNKWTFYMGHVTTVDGLASVAGC